MSLPTMPTYTHTYAHMPAPVGRAETVYYHPCLMDIYEVDNEDTAITVNIPDSDTMTIRTLDSISTFTSLGSSASSQKLGSSHSRSVARHDLGLHFTPPLTGTKQTESAMDDEAVARGCGLAVGSPSGLRRLLGLRRGKAGR